jgi:hypothetical protein
MIWSESDDKELQTCLDELMVEQKKHELILVPLGVIINNIKNIQTRTSISYMKNEEPTKILPKDEWGINIKDTPRLKLKKECISKTKELLG